MGSGRGDQRLRLENEQREQREGGAKVGHGTKTQRGTERKRQRLREGPREERECGGDRDTETQREWRQIYRENEIQRQGQS